MRALSLIVAFAFCTSIPAFAQTVDVCTQVAKAIDHPAQYVAEKVRQCKKNFLGVLDPYCCFPGWELRPHCYVTKNKKIADGWQELKTELECKPERIANGAGNVMRYYFDPKIAILGNNAQFIETLKLGLAPALTAAEPLPQDVISSLKPFVEKRIVPFSLDLLQGARWISSSNDLAKAYHPHTYKQKNKDTITYGNLIIAGPVLRSSVGCRRLAIWAHEMTHVHQYNSQGFNAFTKNYLDQSASGVSYENLPEEKQAYAVENIVDSSCKGD